MHYGCDFFESKGIRLTISYTELYSTPDRRAKPDFRETSIKADGLIAQVFQYSVDGEYRYQATFPSDEMGKPLANFQFRSKEPTVANVAVTVLQTVRLKTKLKGPQRIYRKKVCDVPSKPIPETMKFADIVKSIGTVGDAELAAQIRQRRLSYDITPERLEQLIKAGIGRVTLSAIQDVRKEMDEQERVYDTFAENYSSREADKLKISLNAGREFLDRWECDPLWEEHVKFIRAHLPRLEHQIGYPW